MNELTHAPQGQIEQVTPMDLLQLAISKEGSIEVLERLKVMQNEERDYQAKVAFDDALSRCQSRLSRIAADADNPQTRSRYATYAKIDKVIRPVYTSEGFSISFGENNCPYPNKTRFVAYLSRSGVTREYFKDMTASTKGPKGNDVMTPVHAEAALDSYAKRYLLKDIFNVAIGEDDDDGNLQPEIPREYLPETTVMDYVDALNNAPDLNSLKSLFAECWEKAKRLNDGQAKQSFQKAYEAQKRRLQP